MKLDDACFLAAEIERDFAMVRVIAIGRFLPVDQITDRSPWKISVMVRSDDKPTVIGSREEAVALRFEPDTKKAAAGMLF